jgi:hypothetical protein|tara:strand:- start:1077 stop:1199 length:123 start_codon:yes stop_codon:yes gene_type:complete
MDKWEKRKLFAENIKKELAKEKASKKVTLKETPKKDSKLK